MSAPRTLARTIALAAALALPAPALAQYDLDGFVGTVTLASYGECQDFFCANAVIAIGQGGSGDFFARLVRFEHSFDADGWHELIGGSDLYLGHDVRYLEFGFQEPIPANAELPWWDFIFEGDVRPQTQGYVSAPGPDWLTVGYIRYQRELWGGPGGAELGIDMGFRMHDPIITAVTVTPEPATIALVGAGLGALGLAARRRRAR